MVEVCKIKCKSVNKFDTGAQDVVFVPAEGSEPISFAAAPQGGCLISWTAPPLTFVPGQVYSIQITAVK